MIGDDEAPLSGAEVHWLRSEHASDEFKVVVGDCGTWSGGTALSCATPTQKYSGTLANLSSVSLGNSLGAEKHRYQISVSLDPAAGNAYQGDLSTTELDFDAA